MTFNATQKEVSATIRKIDGKTIRNAIQTACLHVIGHAMQFGHSPLANTLNDQMNMIPMTRKLAPMVVSYLTTNGPLNYSQATGFVFSKAKRDALNLAGYEYEEFVLEAPQWDDVAAKTKEATTLDMVKAIEQLVKKGEKKVVDGAVVDADLLPMLTALLGQYNGKKAIAKASEASRVVEAVSAVNGVSLAV